MSDHPLLMQKLESSDIIHINWMCLYAVNIIVTRMLRHVFESCCLSRIHDLLKPNTNPGCSCGHEYHLSHSRAAIHRQPHPKIEPASTEDHPWGLQFLGVLTIKRTNRGHFGCVW